MPMTQHSETAIKSILKQLNASSSSIELSSVVMRDGQTVASVFGTGIDSGRIGAMFSSLLSLSEKAAIELRRGALKQVLIQAEDGHVLVLRAGGRAVLSVVSKPGVDLGKLLLDARKASGVIETMNLI